MHTHEKGMTKGTGACPDCASPLVLIGEPPKEQPYCAGCGWNHPYRRRWAAPGRRRLRTVGQMLGTLTLLVSRSG